MDNQSSIASNITPNAAPDQEYKVVVFGILLIWSLIGNSLVVAVIFYNKNLRTCFNYLVLNMTISDILNALLGFTVRIYDTTEPSSWPGGSTGDAICKLVYFFADITPTVSIFTLVVVAFERFTAIVFSKRVNITKKKTLILTVLTWLFSMGIYSPYLYAFKAINSDCRLDLEFKDFTLYYSILIILVFVIPFVSIMVVYTTILIKLRQAAKDINRMLDSRQARSRHRRNQNIFCLSLIIIAAFAVFWGPFFSYTFVFTFVWKFMPPKGVDFVKIISIVDILGLTHSCTNPCIYFLFQKNYRHGLNRIWRRLFKKRIPGSSDDVFRLTSQNTYYSRRNSRQIDSATRV